MTGAEVPWGTIIKVGGTIITKAPKGYELIKSWLKGKKILIVGQERAGKTTFLDYFYHGFWGNEKETRRTYKDLPTARFNVKLGKNETLEIHVSTAIDTPGQSPYFQLAEKAFEQNPNALLIFMDLTQSLRASEKWLKNFCRKLEDHWRVNRTKRNRVQSIILVLNKMDRAIESEIVSRKKAFQQILDSELRDARGKMLDDIIIMPTVMIDNPKKTESVDNLIAHLAKSLI